MRIYSRLSRAAANIALSATVFFTLSGGEGVADGLLSACLLVGSILVYGYFIASQHCEHCTESFIATTSNPRWLLLQVIVLPFVVPFRCPHCGEPARW